MGLINWIFDFYQQYRIDQLRDEAAKVKAEATVTGAGGQIDVARLESALGELALAVKTVQRMMRRVTREVGIDRKLTPHSFRHAFVHRLARLGVPDALIAQAVGHSTPFSVSHYTKLSRPELEEVARKQFEARSAA